VSTVSRHKLTCLRDIVLMEEVSDGIPLKLAAIGTHRRRRTKRTTGASSPAHLLQPEGGRTCVRLPPPSIVTRRAHRSMWCDRIRLSVTVRIAGSIFRYVTRAPLHIRDPYSAGRFREVRHTKLGFWNSVALRVCRRV
jgi:hypothetical protein